MCIRDSGNTLIKLDKYIFYTLIVMTLVLMFGFAVSVIHFSVRVKDIHRPIGQLLYGTKELSRGNLGHMINIIEPEEFEILALSFNQMTAELKQHRDGLEDLVKKRTVEIERSEEKYRNLVESSDDIVFSLNENWEFTTVSRAVRQQLGYAPEDVMGKPLYSLQYITSSKKENMERQLFMDKLESLEPGKVVKIKTFFNQKYSDEPRELRVRLEYIETSWGREILGKASSVGEDSLLNLLISEQQSYVTNNYITNAESISQRVTRNLVKYLDKTTVVSIRISVREMIINAIEHGNLNIDFKEKTTAQSEGNYMKFIAERQRDPLYSNRTIEVDYSLTEKEFMVRIKDQGMGFDYREMMKEQYNGDNNKMTHGRGIILSLIHI